jgi:hypothetical protein
VPVVNHLNLTGARYVRPQCYYSFFSDYLAIFGSFLAQV